MGFTSLGLSSPIVQAVSALGYDKPTAVQTQAIPSILEGSDVMVAAQTGTGKTAAFLLPLLHQLDSRGQRRSNQVRCLILVPTRELATQLFESAQAYGKFLQLRMAAVFGGVKINPQMMKMRKGVDLLVATPGRLLDLANTNAVRFDQLETLVLDEADRMLNLGFADELENLLALLPQSRQNLMFSATFSAAIRALAKSLSTNALEIEITPANTAAKTVRQWLCPVDKKKKPMLLIALIRDNHWHQVLVFTKTRKGADQLCRYLASKGISATAIHGDKSQSVRTRALADFKAGTVEILVATDIAARGLDIDGLPQVVNFELPTVAEDYIHRIGRTGRSGLAGEAVSLVCADEFEQLNAVEQLIRQTIPREEFEGFEPKHNVPPSKTIVGPKKPKKPKKPKHSRGRRTETTSQGNTRPSDRVKRNSKQPASRRPSNR